MGCLFLAWHVDYSAEIDWDCVMLVVHISVFAAECTRVVWSYLRTGMMKFLEFALSIPQNGVIDKYYPPPVAADRM